MATQRLKMLQNIKWKNLHWLWLALVILIMDQLTKHLATQFLTYGLPFKLTSFFNLTLIHNQGMAFSFLSQPGFWQELFLASVAILACCVIVIIVSSINSNRFLTLTSLSFILGGALGNLADRLRHGYVVDFIDLHIKNWHWPAFNIADAAITVGAILLIIEMLFRGQQESSN